MTDTPQLARDEMRLSWKRRGDQPFLPLPALRGERVGVRGSFGKFDSWRVPLTRRSPDDASHRRESADLSPQAGRGDPTALAVVSASLRYQLYPG